MMTTSEPGLNVAGMGTVLAVFLRITDKRASAMDTGFLHTGLPVHLPAMPVPPLEPAAIGAETPALVPGLLLERLVTLHTPVGIGFFS